MASRSQALGLGLYAAIVLYQWDQGAEAAPGAAPAWGIHQRRVGKETEAQAGNPQHTCRQRAVGDDGPKTLLTLSWSFTFLSPSRGASGRLLGGSEGSETGGPSPGTAFRGEGPPGSLGGPSAAPLSPPSGELRWLQGPDDT